MRSPLVGGCFNKEVKCLCIVGSRMALSFLIVTATIRIVESNACSSVPCSKSCNCCITL